MRALPSLGLIALLSACTVQSEIPRGPRPSRYAFDAPLRARILNVDGRIRVSTSRPAYIAIFEIVPGQGAGLLYPAYRGENNFLTSGMSSLWISQTRPYYPYFMSAPRSFAGSEGMRMPRYLYLVASDAPLRVSRFIESPGMLRRSLGISQFASANPYSMLDQLAGLVLPFDEAGEWTDDLFVVWPEERYDTRYPSVQWLRVQCADGRIIEGPAYYVFDACRAGEGVPPLRVNPREPGEPGDTTEVQEPTRKRPEPRTPEPGSSAEEGARLSPRAPIIQVVPEPTERIRPSPEERRGPGDRRTAEWTRISAQDDGTPRRAEPQPGETPRIESQPEPRVEPRAEPRQEPRVETLPESRAEPRQEPRQEPRVESRPEPRVEPRVESAPQVEVPRAEPVSQPAARPEPPF